MTLSLPLVFAFFILAQIKRKRRAHVHRNKQGDVKFVLMARVRIRAISISLVGMVGEVLWMRVQPLKSPRFVKCKQEGQVYRITL